MNSGVINTGSAAGIRGVPTVIVYKKGVEVDRKVGGELLNQSQEGITKILAGVKKYGTLAEFSLDALIKDLLPASQFMINVKMKEDTSENVEYAIKLQGDVMVPVDSHFPLEKFKAIVMLDTESLHKQTVILLET